MDEAVSRGLEMIGLGLGAGLALIGVGLGALGIGLVFKSLVTEVSRNPNLKNDLFRFALIGAALIEMLALIGVVVAFILIFK